MGGLLAAVNGLIGPRKPNKAKSDPYECGLPSEVTRTFRFGLGLRRRPRLDIRCRRGRGLGLGLQSDRRRRGNGNRTSLRGRRLPPNGAFPCDGRREFDASDQQPGRADDEHDRHRGKALDARNDCDGDDESSLDQKPGTQTDGHRWILGRAIVRRVALLGFRVGLGGGGR